jgi:hypothetical protein
LSKRSGCRRLGGYSVSTCVTLFELVQCVVDGALVSVSKVQGEVDNDFFLQRDFGPSNPQSMSEEARVVLDVVHSRPSNPQSMSEEARVVLDVVHSMETWVNTYMGKSLEPNFGFILVTPPCLGVTRGDHVSWTTMKTMISMMTTINRSIYGSPTTPLRCLFHFLSTNCEFSRSYQLAFLVCL